jgi:hypothetical protein
MMQAHSLRMQFSETDNHRAYGYMLLLFTFSLLLYTLHACRLSPLWINDWNFYLLITASHNDLSVIHHISVICISIALQ